MNGHLSATASSSALLVMSGYVAMLQHAIDAEVASLEVVATGRSVFNILSAADAAPVAALEELHAAVLHVGRVRGKQLRLEATRSLLHVAIGISESVKERAKAADEILARTRILVSQPALATEKASPLSETLAKFATFRRERWLADPPPTTSKASVEVPADGTRCDDRTRGDLSVELDGVGVRGALPHGQPHGTPRDTL